MKTMETTEFLRAEKKELLKKVTQYLSKKLVGIQESGELTDLEIMKITGWTNTRISEIRYFDRYGINLPEKHLSTLITKGFITVSELKENLVLNEKEENYVDSLKIYEILKKNPKLAALIIKYEEKEINLTEVLEENLKD